MFSIVKQATVLGFMPRFRVFHTDAHGEGQVYIPAVNWSLFLGCVAVNALFPDIDELAAAYGVAVTEPWVSRRSSLLTLPCTVGLEFRFCLGDLHSNSVSRFGVLRKQPFETLQRRLLPIAGGGFLVSVMIIWQWGRQALAKAFMNLVCVKARRSSG